MTVIFTHVLCLLTCFIRSLCLLFIPLCSTCAVVVFTDKVGPDRAKATYQSYN